MQKDRKEKRTDKRAGHHLNRAQQLRRLSLRFLPVGIGLGIAGTFAGIMAGRLIYVLAFTAPAVSFLVMGIFFREFPVGEDLPVGKDLPVGEDLPIGKEKVPSRTQRTGTPLRNKQDWQDSADEKYHLTEARQTEESQKEARQTEERQKKG